MMLVFAQKKTSILLKQPYKNYVDGVINHPITSSPSKKNYLHRLLCIFLRKCTVYSAIFCIFAK